MTLRSLAPLLLVAAACADPEPDDRRYTLQLAADRDFEISCAAWNACIDGYRWYVADDGRIQLDLTFEAPLSADATLADLRRQLAAGGALLDDALFPDDGLTVCGSENGSVRLDAYDPARRRLRGVVEADYRRCRIVDWDILETVGDPVPVRILFDQGFDPGAP
jgi:hypothetical protein